MITEKRKYYLEMLMVFLAVGLVALPSQSVNAEGGDLQRPVSKVSVVLAEERMLAPTIKATGSVVSLHASKISAQVAGELSWIVEVGTLVNKGDVIARIDATILKANKEIAQSKIKKLEADLNFRIKEVNRFKRLANKDNTSKTKLQEEIAIRDMLVQDIFGAKANFTKVEYAYQHAEIKAPFGGHIVSRSANIGEYLTVGLELLKLVDTFNKEIVLKAPLKFLPVLKKNMPVQVVNQGKVEHLPIKVIVPVGDNNSRMIEVRLHIKSDIWTVGESVSVQLPSAVAQKQVVIPRDAIIVRGTDLFIYRVDKNMNAQQLKVEIKTVDNAWVSLRQQLNIGDKIITRGGARLSPGQRVSFLVSP